MQQRSTSSTDKTNYLNGLEYFEEYTRTHKWVDLSLSIQFLRAAIKEGCISARYQIICILAYLDENPVDDDLKDKIEILFKLSPSLTYKDRINAELLNIARDYKYINANTNELSESQKNNLIDLLKELSLQAKNKTDLIKNCIFKIIKELYKDDSVNYSHHIASAEDQSNCFQIIHSYFPSIFTGDIKGLKSLDAYLTSISDKFIIEDIKEDLITLIKNKPTFYKKESILRLLKLIDTLDFALNPPYSPNHDKNKALKINLQYTLINFLFSVSQKDEKNKKQILLIINELIAVLQDQLAKTTITSKVKKQLRKLKAKTHKELLAIGINSEKITVENPLQSKENEEGLAYNFFVMIYNAINEIKNRFNSLEEAAIAATYFLNKLEILFSTPDKLNLLSEENRNEVIEMAGYAYYILGVYHLNERMAKKEDPYEVKNFFEHALQRNIVSAKYWLLKLEILHLIQKKPINYKNKILLLICDAISYYQPPAGFKELSKKETLDFYLLISSYLKIAGLSNIQVANPDVKLPAISLHEYLHRFCAILLSTLTNQYPDFHEAKFELAKLWEYTDPKEIAHIISLLYQSILSGSLIALNYLESKFEEMGVKEDNSFKLVKEMLQEGNLFSENNVLSHINFIIKITSTIPNKNEIRDKMIIVLIEKILRTHEDKESILLPIAEKLLQELTSQQKNQKFHLDISNLHDLARQKRVLCPDSATSIDRNFLTNIQEVGQSSGSSSKASAKNRRKKKNKNKVNNPVSSISNAETKEAQPTEKAKTIIEHKEEVENLESQAITVTKVSKNRKRKNKKKSLATLPSKDSSNNEKSEKEKPSIRANSELAPATFSSSRDRKYRRDITLNDFISSDVKERIFKTSSYKRRLRLLQTDRREGPSVSTERQSKLEPIANIKLPQVAYSIMQLIPNSYLVGNKVREEVSKTILGVNSNHFYENGQFELVSTQPLPLQKTLLIGGLLFIRNEQNPNLFVHDEIFKINLVFTDQSLLQHANSLDFSVNAFYANSDGDVFDPLNKAKQGLLDRKADLLNGLDCFTAQPCSILTYIRLLSLGYEEKYSPDTLKNYYSGLSALTSDKVNHELCQLFMNGFALRSFDVLERFELLDLFFPNIDDEGKKWLKEQLKNSDFLHAQQKLSKVFIFKLFISARLQSDIRNGNKESITLKDVKEIMREFNYPQSLQKKITRQLSVAITRMQKQEEQEVKDVNPEQSTSQPNPDRQVLPRAPIAIGRLFDRNPQDPTSKGHQPVFRPF